MLFVSAFDPYIERFLPGSVKDQHIPEAEGPVTTVLGDAFCVFYVRFPKANLPEVGSETAPEVRPEILYRREHDEEYQAGRDFGRMMAFAGEHRKERPPEGAHPAEVLMFEEDRDRALTDIVRAQVAFENHPDLAPEEIISRRLDRPPGERT
jgi:hypothetical protein